MADHSSQTIVILGGGFAGVELAKAIQYRLPRGWQVILFSEENHLIFTPMLAEVVGTSINPLHVVWPIRQMLPGVACRTASVTNIDLKGRKVTYRLVDGRTAEQAFDHIVLACGSESHMDVMPGMAAHGWPLKTLGDAVELRNRLISRLEEAEVEPDPDVKRRLLSFVVVGGGFSGVEVAGEANDLLRDACRYYRNVTPQEVRVTLLHSRDVVLPELSRSLGVFCQEKLKARGVDVRLNTRAQAVTARDVRVGGGERIPAGTIICTIGNTANPLITALGLPMQRWRVETGPDLRVKGQDNVWALGDCAAVPNRQDGQTSPATAQFAVRHAKHLAKNLVSAIRGNPTEPFGYKNRGMFASIGHHTAVGEVFGIKVSGFVAWFMWRGFYLLQMPTLARKLQIAFDWFWDLFFPRDMVMLANEHTGRLDRAHYEPGQYVFRKGDPATRFFLVERGSAGVYLDEAKDPVAVVGPGEYFGERGVLGGGVRTASVRAEEPLDVLRLDEASFRQLVGHFDDLRTRIEAQVKRIDTANKFRSTMADAPALTGTPVGEVMRPPHLLAETVGYRHALQQCRDEGVSSCIVVDADGKMVGFCSQTDLYQAAGALLSPETPLSDVMHKSVVSIREDEPAAAAAERLLGDSVKRLVVTAADDPTKAVGLVTLFELMPLLGGDAVGTADTNAELAGVT